jgi:hypothetical protein
MCDQEITIGKSIIRLVLWEFLHAFNDVFNNQIQWDEINSLLNAFKEFVGLPCIQGAIDVPQILS